MFGRSPTPQLVDENRRVLKAIGNGKGSAYVIINPHCGERVIVCADQDSLTSGRWHHRAFPAAQNRFAAEVQEACAELSASSDLMRSTGSSVRRNTDSAASLSPVPQVSPSSSSSVGAPPPEIFVWRFKRTCGARLLQTQSGSLLSDYAKRLIIDMFAPITQKKCDFAPGIGRTAIPQGPPRLASPPPGSPPSSRRRRPPVNSRDLYADLIHVTDATWTQAPTNQRRQNVPPAVPVHAMRARRAPPPQLPGQPPLARARWEDPQPPGQPPLARAVVMGPRTYE